MVRALHYRRRPSNLNGISSFSSFKPSYIVAMASQTKEDEQAALEASIASLIVNSESDISEATMLLQRCRVLLDDIEQFERHMASKNFKIELRHFKSGVQTECKQLEKVYSLSLVLHTDH